VAVYDTGDHQITGFSQQQGGGQSIALTSQHGLVRIADLKVIDAAAEASSVEPGSPHVADKPAPTADAPEPQVAAYDAPVETAPAPKGAASSGQSADEDIFGKIERLAALHAKGILTDKEFEAKKADLLDRV
ncbi:MAG: SHOCT domain-containing protein, partial [Alphaproteobacteria bacterium]